MKNICYFATTFNGINTGKGGHYYSLATTAKGIQNLKKNVFVLNIGNKNSIVLEQADLNYNWIRFNGKNLKSTLKNIEDFLTMNKISLIHCFDKNSTFFGLYFSKKLKIKLVATKCGGPVTWWHPKINQLIVFSKEDLIHFQNKSSFRKDNVHLISNRVLPFEGNEIRIKKLIDDFKIDTEVPIFLRICRITSQNFKSINQTINLVEKLNKKECKCHFLIIGVIEGVSTYGKIQKTIEKSENGQIITSDEFTHNSKELIPIAHFVVGSGRSIMEAANFSLPLLVPNSSLEIPVPLNKKTFEESFKNNFSYRSRFNLDSDDVLNEIISILKNPEKYKNYQLFSQNVFKEFFNLNVGIKKIKHVYDAAQYENSPWPDIIKIFGIIYYNLFIGFVKNIKASR